jgi:arsenate reductase
VICALVLMVLAVLALGQWYPGSGAEQLDWKPTRSPQVEAQNEIDDVAQMISAQNRIRARGGKAPRTIEDVEAQVRDQEQRLRDYADAYWKQQHDERVGVVNAEGGLTVYEVSTCSKCQRLGRILGEREIEYERVDIIQTPLSAPEITALLAKAGIAARDALRANEPAGRELRDAPEAEIVAAMAANPALIARPIVVRGDRAVLARPTERALELL